MTHDEELIQTFEGKADTIMQKAQQYLAATLPGGPGVFAYVVMSNVVGKLVGNTKEYVEQAVSRPITLPDFVYSEPLDEELEEFFEDERLHTIRAEFPEKYEDFTHEDWAKMRRYYMPLYYTLVIREPFVTEMFAAEIQTQNYKRIIEDFDLFPVYKKSIQSIPSASRQNALWSAVSGVLKETVNEVWNKEYAKQVFEEANNQPEVAALVQNVKDKIREKIDLNQLVELKNLVGEFTGRETPAPGRTVLSRDEDLIQTMETKTDAVLGKAQQYLAAALPGGPGVFTYVVMANTIGKLFGNTREYVEQAVSRPVTLPDFVYSEPLDEELEVFFEDGRLQTIRAEFPEKYEDFTNEDWAEMRRYYMPLYYTLVIREPFVTEMFAVEIQTQNYKRIIEDFELFPLYKKSIQSIPSASRHNALWSAVTGVLTETVHEVWRKDYAKEVFEEAQTHPEVIAMIENVKTTIREKVNVAELVQLKDVLSNLAGEMPIDTPLDRFWKPVKSFLSRF
jgi:nucleoid DNA-binding protein